MVVPDATPGEELICLKCGYELRGLTSRDCPECGASFDPDHISKHPIPWTMRRELGRFSAYWRTVWLVMAHPKRFCLHIARPVSLADARRFQWVTVGLVMIAAVVVTIVVSMHFDVRGITGNLPSRLWPLERLLSMVPPNSLPIVFNVLLVGFLIPATGMHTYWFHPSVLTIRRQNRALALSYYCCAPLAWASVTACVAVAAYLRRYLPDAWQTGALIAVADTLFIYCQYLLVILLVLWWGLPQLTARRAHVLGPFETLGLALGLPALWLGLAAVVFGAVPAIGFYASLLIHSLF
ncbi:MAG: hypothetical protein CMJ18_06190 [Phycisphaeraceae bacterium]|nr:hypothetical protein [Phycisphaeraceae bacterium]